MSSSHATLRHHTTDDTRDRTHRHNTRITHARAKRTRHTRSRAYKRSNRREIGRSGHASHTTAADGGADGGAETTPTPPPHAEAHSERRGGEGAHAPQRQRRFGRRNGEANEAKRWGLGRTSESAEWNERTNGKRTRSCAAAMEPVRRPRDQQRSGAFDRAGGESTGGCVVMKRWRGWSWTVVRQWWWWWSCGMFLVKAF